MKSNSQISLSHASWMTIVLLMLTLPLPALAALGGDLSSVQEDQAQMKGTLKTTEARSLHHPRNHGPGNTVVKEYASPAGKGVCHHLARTVYSQHAAASGDVL